MEGDLGWCCSNGSNNWDLHAVVRFACTGGRRVPTPSVSDDSFSWLPTTPTAPEEDPYPGFPPPQPYTEQLMDAAASSSQLPLADPAVDDLCLQAFFASPKAETPQVTSPRNEAPPPQRSPADGSPAKPRSSGLVNGGGGLTRSKRKSKKSQVKKEVTRVPAGRPSADLWEWRKYGQKPIKGSPYPRGYYRCSTDKQCKARKQVERCRTDPATLIVTYTGGHSHPVPLHRNSLAGTTRNKTQPTSPSPAKKPTKPQAAMSAADTKSQGSPSPSSTGLSPSPSTKRRSLSLGAGDEEDHDTDPARLLFEGTEMEVEDDVLLFLMSSDEPSPGPGSGSSCDCEDVMLFSKPGKPPATTSMSRTDGGTAAASVMDIAEEKVSVSGLSSAWEAASVAATSSWG